MGGGGGGGGKGVQICEGGLNPLGGLCPSRVQIR